MEYNKKDGCKSGCTKHIDNVVCDVKNCYYNDCNCRCTAKQITVGPGGASTSEDTACVTFKPKEEF